MFPYTNNQVIDKLFVQALLIACIGTANVLKNQISDDVFGFVYGMQIFLQKNMIQLQFTFYNFLISDLLAIRTNREIGRLGRMMEYKDDLIYKLHNSLC